MKFLVILLLISVISLVAADGGEYVPKAFYFLDENGRPSIPQPISQETLNRVRRQVQPGFNQPNFGGFAFPQPVFNFPQINPAQGTGSFVSSSQSLSSRFGDDEPVIKGQTQTFHHSDGKYHQITSHLNPDGTVTTNKQSGRVKRDMSQTQSQGNPSGMTQFQSQSQNAPGGVQSQSQSQPNMSQSQTQGDIGATVTKGSFDHVQESEQDPLNSDIASDGLQKSSLPPSPSQQPEIVPAPPSQRPEQNNQNIPEISPNSNIPPQQQQQHVPQGPPPQQHYPNQPQQPNYHQQQPYYPQQQPFYPQGQQFPFGFGQFGFPQTGQFGFPQAGFGPFGFPQTGFGFPQQQQPGFVQQPAFGQIGSLDNRFGEDEVPVNSVGASQSVVSQNGNYHITSSVLKPDGQVVTSQQSGRNYHG
ncbi:hypothetical protein PVAND_001130 [Polypedilum vanderplanki]|uniref:Uncharacterized protein n=1 Tax=Polypedilum vanderplanki TaxID=319348 RepID=A0A9J6BN92_POLVA|nr:hypothetical protein PVAND_001130 [Polypedilum vanderplanki]